MPQLAGLAPDVSVQVTAHFRRCYQWPKGSSSVAVGLCSVMEG